jgi:hypothetical protein
MYENEALLPKIFYRVKVALTSFSVYTHVFPRIISLNLVMTWVNSKFFGEYGRSWVCFCPRSHFWSYKREHMTASFHIYGKDYMLETANGPDRRKGYDGQSGTHSLSRQEKPGP